MTTEFATGLGLMIAFLAVVGSIRQFLVSD